VLSIDAKINDLAGPKRHTCRNKKNYGAHQKNFNEDRLILSAAKCRPMILLSRNIKYTQIFAGVPSWRGIKYNKSKL